MLVLAAGAAPPFFAQVTLLLLAAALIAYISTRLGQVPIIGFLVAGAFIGPHGVGLVRDQALVDAAAEVGVILLLFTIGIEFSLEKLSRIQRLIFGGGGLQVLLATGVTTGVLMLLGVGFAAALFTGFLVALSSTAIVLKLLGDRGEMNTEPGQVGLGLLIFQDLAIIVMVLLVPMLAGQGGGALALGWALSKAVLIIVLVLVVARRLLPPLLEAVARTCSPEVFLLSVVALCFGTALLTSLAGVSLSLGAFLAGLIVSESRFSEHAMGEILPLQVLFSATFFVSVGMLLDVGFLVSNLPLVLGVVGAVLLIKTGTTMLSVRALGYSMPVAAASGLLLGQVGEFSFVLERAGRELGLLPAGVPEGSQTFIAATVLLMVATPGLHALGTRLSARMNARTSTARPEADGEALPDLPPLQEHVVVAGYGDAARVLTRALQSSQIPFVVTTLNPAGAREAEEDGMVVLRGDSSRQHVLEHVGLRRADVLVVADDDPAQAHRIISVARTLSPHLRIVARTRTAAEADELVHAGADHVVTEEMESVVALLHDVLRTYARSGEDIAAHTLQLRQYARDLPAQPPTPSREARAAVTLAPGRNACGHLPVPVTTVPGTAGCEECLQTGDTWVHLRVCMTCGHVGCCDASKNKHATQHYHDTAHPVMRSAEAGESWGWCYVDEVML